MPRIRSSGPVTQFSILPPPAYRPPRNIAINPSDMEEDYWYFEWLENKDYVRSDYLKTDKQVMLAKIQIAKARLRGVDVPSSTPLIVEHGDEATNEALSIQSQSGSEDSRERDSVQNPPPAGSEQNQADCDNKGDYVSISTCEDETNSHSKRSVEDDCDNPPAKRICVDTPPAGTPLSVEQPGAATTHTVTEHVPTNARGVIGPRGGDSTSGETRRSVTDGVTANGDPMVLGEDHTFTLPESVRIPQTPMEPEAGDHAPVEAGLETEYQGSIGSERCPVEGRAHTESNSVHASHPVPLPHCDEPRPATTAGSIRRESIPGSTVNPPQEAFSSEPPRGGGPAPAPLPSSGYAHSNTQGQERAKGESNGRESRANEEYIDERESLIRQLELLRMRFRDARIPVDIDRDPNITNVEIKRVVARNIQHLRRNRNIATYKLGMVGSLLLMELFFARFCRIDMLRFMKWHYSNMQSYEELLADLGEVSTPLTDASGGVQLMVLLVFNTFLFIANELLVKFFSIDVLHVMASITGADIGSDPDTSSHGKNGNAGTSPQRTTPDFTQNFCRHFAT